MAQSDTRDYWIQLMTRIAGPVLIPLSEGKLRASMKVEYSPTFDKRPRSVAYLEAFGRLMSGIAPFLGSTLTTDAEDKLRDRMLHRAQRCLTEAVNPDSPDFMLWYSEESRQPLVDAAYLVQAFLSAPDVLWKPLSKVTRSRYVEAFKKLRDVKPHNNNWLVFPAMLESFLRCAGEDFDRARIDTAVKKINEWYIGDGWYKDGPAFHFDNYNGFDIHPMLTQVLEVNQDLFGSEAYKLAHKRMQRYAQHLERYVSPEGFYPVFGRSSTYRAAAFWPLTKLALEDRLPSDLKPSQVRCALTAVLRRLFVDDCFTKTGELTLGLTSGDQRSMADHYSNTGSMYITSLVLLPLGLPPSHPFWSSPDSDWTQRKAWSGKPFRRDSPRV